MSIATLPGADVDPDAQASIGSVAAGAAPAHFRIPARVIHKVSIGHRGRRLEIPHIARFIISIILGTEETSPICILLPSTEHVAQFTALIAAIECLAADFPSLRDEFIAQRMKPGTRVRALPDGNTFIVGERRFEHGIDGVFMRYTEKRTLESNGRRLIPLDDLLRYEPTTRSLPVSRSGTKLTRPKLSSLDEIARTRTFGNSALYRTRVVLVGSRAEFQRTLENTSLLPDSVDTTGRPPISLADDFAWGTFNADGRPIVLNPSGAGGSPLVAIARDFIDLETACLSPTIAAGSLLVVTERLDLVLKSLDLANRVGERQRLLVLADARRRSDVETLQSHGWRIWEPRPWELLPAEGGVDPARTGVPGIDRIQQSAYAEQAASSTFAETDCPELAAAFTNLNSISAALKGEAADFDERMLATLDDVTSLFFQAANWLSFPSGDRLETSTSTLRRLRTAHKYIERYLGPEVGAALEAFIAALEAFLSHRSSSTETPKGRILLDLVRSGQGADEGILITGSAWGKEEAKAFLAENGFDLRCLLARERTDEEVEFPSVLAVSILRSDPFARLVDPWPAKNVVFAGYGFELDIYKKRLHRRNLLRDKLAIDAAARAALTSLPATAFGDGKHATSFASDDSSDAHEPEALERLAKSVEWNWRRRIAIPATSPGEISQDARVVRFVGRSWMAMTEDHRVPSLLRLGQDRRISNVQNVGLSDLQPGVRLIVREGGGERDVIQALAQEICGEEKYEELRRKASLWREALRSRGSTPESIARRLEHAGVYRHIVTIRSWLTNPSLIGPRSDADVRAIAEAFPLPRATKAHWKECCDAISELRALHLSAGRRLTDLLVARCGQLLWEPMETETAVDLEIGTVWILEVTEVESLARRCPASVVNRLQWLDDAWRDRLLRTRVSVEGA